MTATPSATVCPDCRALIPATTDDRRAHREWHADLKAKHRGVQKRIAEIDETTSRAVEAVRELRRDVEATEIPEAVEPMRIEEWPEDELDPEQTSQYLHDEIDDVPDTAAEPTDPDDYFADQPATR